jgi:hypothetical protein
MASAAGSETATILECQETRRPAAAPKTTGLDKGTAVVSLSRAGVRSLTEI